MELTAEQHRLEIAARAPGNLVMVVDDDACLVDFVQKALEARGYETVATCSPRAALGLLRDKSPDLILLDISMPELDGSELFARIREMPHTKRTPVIFMTGLINPEEENAFNHTRDGLRRHYLGKPFDSDKLVSSIAAMIAA